MQDHRPVPTFPIRLIWNWLLLSTPDQAPAYSHWLPESILYDALLWLKSRRCMCFYEIHIEYKKYSKAIVMVNKLTYHYCIGVAGNVFQAWAIKVSLPEQLLCSVKAKIFNFTSDRKKNSKPYQGSIAGHMMCESDILTPRSPAGVGKWILLFYTDTSTSVPVSFHWSHKENHSIVHKWWWSNGVYARITHAINNLICG